MNTEEKENQPTVKEAKKATKEEQWTKLPAWKCRVCGWENLAARPSCRNGRCHGRRDA